MGPMTLLSNDRVTMTQTYILHSEEVESAAIVASFKCNTPVRLKFVPGHNSGQ
jgi:hypothetical protein